MRIRCADGYVLGGNLWTPKAGERGTVIVNCATGVLARYYHRYARFLAAAGFAAITYDYRGIGASRPANLRALSAGWRDWGERDFEAVIAFARARDPIGILVVVGHSIGGVVVGYAPSASRIDRILTVGAQFAYWRDYAPGERAALFRRWHRLMPALVARHGYFPGRKLGWLEDLPAGVARDFAAPLARFEDDLPRVAQGRVLARFASVRAPILALTATDDPLGTEAAIKRALGYFTGAERRFGLLRPADFGVAAIGHFSLFHDRFADTFWLATLRWIDGGEQAYAACSFKSSSMITI